MFGWLRAEADRASSSNRCRRPAKYSVSCDTTSSNASALSGFAGDRYVFSILILVLLFRPSGILGAAVAEKV